MGAIIEKKAAFAVLAFKRAVADLEELTGKRYADIPTFDVQDLNEVPGGEEEFVIRVDPQLVDELTDMGYFDQDLSEALIPICNGLLRNIRKELTGMGEKAEVILAEAQKRLAQTS